MLYRIKDFVPCFILRQLYFSFLYPYLNYCILVWGCKYHPHLNSVYFLQKRAIRIICKKDFYAHTTPLFFSSKILKLHDIYKYNLAIQFYKNKDNSQYNRPHLYETRSRNTLRTPLCRLTSSQHSVSYQSVQNWNEIPEVIKNSRSISIFKRQLKNYLLSKYTQ